MGGTGREKAGGYNVRPRRVVPWTVLKISLPPRGPVCYLPYCKCGRTLHARVHLQPDRRTSASEEL